MAKARKKRRSYRPRYPYTLLAEAWDAYRAEVIRDDETRNEFLSHIQPMVRHTVGRYLRLYGTAFRKVDDVVGFVNVKLLESWLPAYLASKGKTRRIREAVRYFTKSVHGYVLKFVKKDYDPRLVPLDGHEKQPRTLEHSADREVVEAAYERMLAEHLTLRPRSDLDVEVVKKLMRFLAWEEYRSIDGVPG